MYKSDTTMDTLSKQPFRPAFYNFGWLVTDRLYRMGLGLVTGLALARYLGPDQYGTWNYALAFSSLFATVAALGLDDLVVKEIALRPERIGCTLGTAFSMKLFGGIAAFGLCLLSLLLAGQEKPTTVILVAFSGGSLLFHPFQTIELFFRSQTKSKIVVITQNIVLTITSSLKLFLILSHSSLLVLGAAGFAEILAGSIGLLLAYYKFGPPIRQWSIDVKLGLQFLHASWPLIFSGLAITIFMKIDIVMLRYMRGSHDVGIYSSAVRVSEIFYFVGMAVKSSFSPALFRLNNYNHAAFNAQIVVAFRAMIFSALIIIVPICLTASIDIQCLFGDQYKGAEQVLLVHTWATLFVFISIVENIYWVAKGLQIFSLISSGSSAILNIILNLILIPRYGPTGAAIATLISYGAPVLVVPMIHVKTRPLFHLMVNSMVPAWAKQKLEPVVLSTIVKGFVTSPSSEIRSS
jgi:PST family polysaccharide transporter